MIGRRLAHHFRVAQCRGAEHDPVDAEPEPMLDRRPVADAAAQLEAQADAVADRRHRSAIDRTAGKGAVEIDDVQPFETGCRELPGLCRRIAVEHGGAGHLAAHQADAGAILQVDRRVEDHGCAWRIVGEQLVVIVAGHDPAVDPRIDRVGAPAAIAEAFIKRNRRALGVAQIEVEHRQPQFAGKTLDLDDDAAAETVAARPGRDEGAGENPGEGLRLVVARRPAQLRRAGDDPVETADHEPALGHQEHALPVILQHLARRRLEPAEPAALGDGALGRLAQIVELVARIAGQPLDRDRRIGALPAAHGRHPRKLPIMRSPASWLFSG